VIVAPRRRHEVLPVARRGVSTSSATSCSLLAGGGTLDEVPPCLNCMLEDCAMSWLVRRNRQEFTGWIAGFGTDSGYRVVIGHWHTFPYGVVIDVMVEDPAGRRTLYAPPRSWPSSSAPPIAPRRPGHRLQCQALGPVLEGSGGPPAAVVHHRTPQPAGMAVVGHARHTGPNDLVGEPDGSSRPPAAAWGPHPWPHQGRTLAVVRRPRSAPHHRRRRRPQRS
jgi:hypothetical protein